MDETPDDPSDHRPDASMTIGDGMGALSVALAATGIDWAVAWASVRHAVLRHEALRRLGEPTWQAKTTTSTRRSA